MFDAAKVRGDLVVRRARAGETLLALDGKTYTLDDTMCVIADDNGPESLAGIMGGEASGCSEPTTDVLIESALWEPLNIAQTGRKLGINSDARYRFERGVDPAFLMPGLELATRMVLDLCGGEPSEITVAGDPQVPELVIDFPLSELKRLAGLDVPLPEVRRVLSRLGFFVAGQGDDREGRGAVVAAGRARQGRHRRGGRAHPRRRPRAGDAVRRAATRRASRCSRRCRCAPARPSARSRRAAWSRR